MLKTPKASGQQDFISVFIIYFVSITFQFIVGFSCPTKL